MKIGYVIIPLVVTVGFAAGVYLIGVGLKKRRPYERFSFGQFMFRTKTMYSSSGTQLIGEGIISIILSASLIFMLFHFY